MTANSGTIHASQPKALYLLVFVQMWECFSFYGMRALLVLYMSSQLQFSDSHALSIYAVYTGLVELGGIAGGMIADRILGLRRAIFLGGWLIALGHIVMAVRSTHACLFFGLALIVVGSGLFSTNISALLGLYYREEGSRREEGFTLFYVGINLGGLLASLLCGTIGELYGWHYGFSLAAIGMILGNIVLYAFRGVLESKGQPPVSMKQKKFYMISPALILAAGLLAIGIAHASTLLYLLPWLSVACLVYVMRRLVSSGAVPVSVLITLGIYLVALALFFAAEEQIGSTLMLFSERHAADTLFGIAIPSTFLLSLNPMTILLIGPCLHRVFRRVGQNKTPGQHAYSMRMVVAFLMGAIAFAGLAFLSLSTNSHEQVPFIGIMISIVIISLAELLVGPTVYSYCSEAAPENEQGIVMGLVPLGFSLASFLGGHISQFMAVSEETIQQSLNIYGIGFGAIAGLLGVTALVLAFGIPVLHKTSKPMELII